MPQCASEAARSGSHKCDRQVMRRKSSKLMLFIWDTEWENMKAACG